MRKPLPALLLGLVSLGTAVGHDTEVVVKIEQGKLRGLAEDNVAVFKGIPFAAPPAGELRWRQRRQKFWDAHFDAGKL